MAEDWTLVLCGPLAQQKPLQSALKRAGANLSEGQPKDPHMGFPTDPTEGWLHVRVSKLNEAVEHVQRAGWSVRLHWPTPDCQYCRGQGAHATATQGTAGCLNCAGTGRSNKGPDFKREVVR